MKKKSTKKAADAFTTASGEIQEFVDDAIGAGLSQKHTSVVYDLAIIKLYREFEQLMLHSLISAINNDSSQLSERTGIDFPKHLTDEVCEYIVLGERYFDFKGRDGLIQVLKRFLKEDHYLLTSVKKARYRQSLDRLSALRNYATHESSISKKTVLKAVGQKRIGTAGAWLKVNNRFGTIKTDLCALANEIKAGAPY